MYRRFGKRALDLVAAGAGLLVTAPLLAAIAIWIRVTSPGPAFYRGLRAGRGGRPFAMLKFRTMVQDADRRGPSSTAADDARITPIGHLLRRFKLDEFPQLINVVKGEMSLVGPRPQVLSVVDGYTERERGVLDVQPGITDWASIRFRNEGEILKGSDDPDRDYLILIHPEKMRLGLEYVNRVSFTTDLGILLRTAGAVFGVGERS
jgi:lipopolysaccharide/colanic/teichoic acid biosynthesis glycosyltransferase